MAERPPSREEVMFDWFVGDAKGILDQASTLRTELVKLREQQEREKVELITAQREVVRAVKDGSQSIALAAQQAGKDAQAVAAQSSRRIAAVALLSAAVGAAIGAAGILALFMSLGL